MRLSDFYKKAIQVGMANDPRGGEILSRELEKRKAEFDEMKPNDKELFDQESLENPYADSRILHGSGEEEVKTLLLGVDIEVGEILMAEALRKRGATVDLVLAHHPEGSAYANLHAVMYMQADILNKFGVPINIAEDLMEGRVREVQRRLMPVNHTRAVDAARLMDIPFACFHTPADNMVVTHLQRLFDEKKPYTIDDVMGLLKEIPEYRDAAKNGAGPTILLGSKNRKAGKVFVDMTGGTEGSKEIFQSLSLSGVNTIVAMHLSEEHRKEAEKHHLNVIIAGHIASDNLGLNLLLDQVDPDGELTVLECSGFKRVRRN